MKWNDKRLPYSGENKSIVYNYVHSVMQKLLKKYPAKVLTNPYVINYILTDIYWDINIFKTKEKHDWFIQELKNNPFLLDFINTEISKIKQFPTIYSKENIQIRDGVLSKEKAFSDIIQMYIINNPDTIHLYFADVDMEQIESEASDYARKFYKTLKCRRDSLHKRYERLLRVKTILSSELGVETTIEQVGRSGLVLQDVQCRFAVTCFRWGDFPTIPKNPSVPSLFCAMDDISVYVFGMVNQDDMRKYSHENYLFRNGQVSSPTNFTAFYGFQKEIFNKTFLTKEHA